MPTLTPPTVDEGIECNDRLIGRYKLRRGVTLIKQAGHWTTVRYPWAGDLDGLVAGTDYFLGGYRYTITSAQATELTNDGFGAYIS